MPFEKQPKPNPQSAARPTRAPEASGAAPARPTQGPELTAAGLLHLQRSIGNRAVGRLLAAGPSSTLQRFPARRRPAWRREIRFAPTE